MPDGISCSDERLFSSNQCLMWFSLGKKETITIGAESKEMLNNGQMTAEKSGFFWDGNFEFYKHDLTSATKPPLMGCTKVLPSTFVPYE